MIGERPKFLDSPFFYADIDGWKLKPGAPKNVQDEYDQYMRDSATMEEAPTAKNNAK